MKTPSNKKNQTTKQEFIARTLTVSAAVLATLLLFVGWVYPEVKWGILTLAALLVLTLSGIAYQNQKSLQLAMKTRSFRYGSHALITTLLVVCIVTVINFLNFNHYAKKDLTKAGKHSLSDQTIKILKELKTDVKVTAFAKAQGRDELKGLFENYKYQSKKFNYEFIDPDREPARAKAAGIKSYGTVILEIGKKESRLENPDEEKLTNALIKTNKDKNQTICFLSGHGEKNPESNEADGYSSIKKEMVRSAWDIKTVNLLEETKVPPACDVVLVLGPTKNFFEKETAVLKTWFEDGGRGLFALDPDVRKGDETHNKQLNELLSSWGITVSKNIVVDPSSKLLGAEASVPLVGGYSRDHPITKEFQTASLFPLASSLELSKAPSGFTTLAIAKSTQTSFSETDFTEISKGRATYTEGRDKKGPLDMMAVVIGKKPESKAPKETRVVITGTSNLATNAYSRHALNSDLFLNAVSWLANDESMISIRPKEEGSQAISLGQTEGRYIQLLTMVLIPFSTFGMGILGYVRRRKL